MMALTITVVASLLLSRINNGSVMALNKQFHAGVDASKDSLQKRSACAPYRTMGPLIFGLLRAGHSGFPNLEYNPAATLAAKETHLSNWVGQFCASLAMLC